MRSTVAADVGSGSVGICKRAKLPITSGWCPEVSERSGVQIIYSGTWSVYRNPRIMSGDGTLFRLSHVTAIELLTIGSQIRLWSVWPIWGTFRA
jgi:hypothetical protein